MVGYSKSCQGLKRSIPCNHSKLLTNLVGVREFSFTEISTTFHFMCDPMLWNILGIIYYVVNNFLLCCYDYGMEHAKLLFINQHY